MSETENEQKYDPVVNFDNAFAKGERVNAVNSQSSTTGYELAYLISPEIAEEKLDLETDGLKRIISENSGEAIKSEIPKKRWLAYAIKKQSQAYFGFIYFNADKENIDGIKKGLSFNKNILRFLIVSEDKESSKQAVKSEPNATSVKLSNESVPVQSFDKKLENILNG